MPAKSKAQLGMMFHLENIGEVPKGTGRHWASETKKLKGGIKGLPEHVKSAVIRNQSDAVADFVSQLMKQAGDEPPFPGDAGRPVAVRAARAAMPPRAASPSVDNLLGGVGRPPVTSGMSPAETAIFNTVISAIGGASPAGIQAPLQLGGAVTSMQNSMDNAQRSPSSPYQAPGVLRPTALPSAMPPKQSAARVFAKSLFNKS